MSQVIMAWQAPQPTTGLIDWSTANHFETVAGSPDTNGNYWNSLGPVGIGDGGDLSATTLTASDNTPIKEAIIRVFLFLAETNRICNQGTKITTTKENRDE